MSGRIRSYEHEGFSVDFDSRRCIHAAECVRGLPEVFDVDKRPWIDPSNAEHTAIAEVIQRCPTGALQFRYPSGSPREEPDEAVAIEILPSGPIYIRGDARLPDSDGQEVSEYRVALCRCGASRNKPFCDNSHIAAGFDDAGMITESKLAPVDGSESAGLDITPAPNGPLILKGRMAVTDGGGQQIEAGRGALCRCGASNNKPFCDGSHSRIGFEVNE